MACPSIASRLFMLVISRLHTVSNFVSVLCATHFVVLCKMPLKCLLDSTIITSMVYFLFLFPSSTVITQQFPIVINTHDTHHYSIFSTLAFSENRFADCHHSDGRSGHSSRSVDTFKKT